MSFSYKPETHRATEAGSPAIWGARAICEADRFALLPNRQSISGEPAARTELTAALNGGVLASVQEKYRELRDAHWDFTRVAREVVFHDGDGVRVVGNTNGSHGYLYLTASINPPAEDAGSGAAEVPR